MKKISFLLFLFLLSCSVTKIKNSPLPYVVIMFDDGSKTVYQNALPVLRRYNFAATNAVITKNIGTSYTISWSELDVLSNIYDWETAAHTYSHPDFTEIDNDELRAELETSLHDLNSHGYYPETLAIPYGKVKRNQLSILKEYFKNIRSVKDIHYHKPIDRYYLGCYLVNRNNTPHQVEERLFYAVEHNEEMVSLLFHRIDNSNEEYSYSIENFKEIMQFLRDNNFRVVTLEEALEKIDKDD